MPDLTPGELADRLEQSAKDLPEAMRRRLRHAAELGRARIRGHASGRPGPNVISGDYRRSWKVPTPRRIPYGAECIIGTEAPQGRRLEFGFYNRTDSLGRHYFQPPFPHVGPAIPYIEHEMQWGVRAVVAEVLR